MQRPRLFSPQLPTLIDPTTCILPLPDKVVVERLPGEKLHIRWQETATAHIFTGPHPAQIDFSRPLAIVENGRETTLPDLDPATRHYFAVQFVDGVEYGRCYLAADRFLPLQGAVNLRDVGGYETEDGRTVRWGQLYRSGVLSQLTEPDQAYLNRLGLRLVCDLRTEAEVQKRPDRLPLSPHLQYLHLPAQNLERSARWRGLAAVLFNRARLDGLMDEGYTRVMVEENAALIGTILRRLAEPGSYPAIIHCSAGKDRTAVITALLLHILRVPWQTILADYTLSNLHYDKYRAGIQGDLKSLRRLGITVDHMQAVMLVKAERLQKMRQHIEHNDGTIAQYLQTKAGINEKIMAQLRQNLLV
jgi:protein-tyrosine phosphatase